MTEHSEKNEVVIVSAFGRGHWVASELIKSGCEVTLIDVSESMGRWTPEDWEGPFGYFQTEKLTPSQRTRLIEDDSIEDIPQGVTIWLPSGPIDFKSSLSSHLLKQVGISEDKIQYLMNFDKLNSEEIKKWKDSFKREAFAYNWIVNLAYQLASHCYYPNHLAFSGEKPLPIASPWVFRRATRKGLSDSISWLQDLGVKTKTSAVVTDIYLENSSLNGFEISSSEGSGIISGAKFIWTLSGEETQKLNSKICDKFYPKGICSSQWYWSRFRYRLKLGTYLNQLPKKFLMIQDLFATWTHENLMIVQRTVDPQSIDVWLRLPVIHRFQREYLEKQNKEIIEVFNERIPGAFIEMLDMPQEYTYSPSEIGPPRFGIYDCEQVNNIHRWNVKNLHFFGPEDTPLYEWGNVLNSQSSVVKEIQNWKNEKEKLEKQAELG